MEKQPFAMLAFKGVESLPTIDPVGNPTLTKRMFFGIGSLGIKQSDFIYFSMSRFDLLEMVGKRHMHIHLY